MSTRHLRVLVVTLLNLCLFVSRSLAAETTSLHLEGNFSSESAISSPPQAPATFEELDSSSFFSLPIAIIDSEGSPRNISTYFWHPSENTIAFRAYVDGNLVGGAIGSPTLVGTATLTFSDSGTKLPSTSPFDAKISVAWIGNSRTNIAVFFNPVTLTDTVTALVIVRQNGSQGGLVDFDGDLIDDFIIFRPDQGIWAIRLSAVEGTTLWKQWGLPGDYPIAGDYTGDGVPDLVVWRPTDGNWYICHSEQSFNCFAEGGNSIFQFGLPNDRPIKGDYDHDGILDLAVWRPSLGLFIYKSSSTNAVTVTQWGLPTDIPLQTVPNN